MLESTETVRNKKKSQEILEVYVGACNFNTYVLTSCSRYIVDLGMKSGEKGGRGGARGTGRVLARKSSKVNPKVLEAMHTLIANSAKVSLSYF